MLILTFWGWGFLFWFWFWYWGFWYLVLTLERSSVWKFTVTCWTELSVFLALLTFFSFTNKVSFSKTWRLDGNSTFKVWVLFEVDNIFLFFSFNCSLYSARDKAPSGLSSLSSGGISSSATTFSFLLNSSGCLSTVFSTGFSWTTSSNFASIWVSTLASSFLGFNTDSNTKELK